MTKRRRHRKSSGGFGLFGSPTPVFSFKQPKGMNLFGPPKGGGFNLFAPPKTKSSIFSAPKGSGLFDFGGSPKPSRKRNKVVKHKVKYTKEPGEKKEGPRNYERVISFAKVAGSGLKGKYSNVKSKAEHEYHEYRERESEYERLKAKHANVGWKGLTDQEKKKITEHSIKRGETV